MPQTVELRECCQQDQLVAAETAPVLRNVKLLGAISKNGRRYSQQAMNAGAKLYESKPVNIDHNERHPTASRSVADRFGIIKNVRQDGQTLRGDLHFNPKHPLAEAVRWWAANEPAAIGLSHNATGTGRTEGQTFVVERLESVRSIDLVADPATTSSLFESLQRKGTTMRLREDDMPPLPPLSGGDGSLTDQVAQLVSSIVKDGTIPDRADKLAKIRKALELLPDEKQKPPAMDEPPLPNPNADADDADDVEESVRNFARFVRGGPRATSHRPAKNNQLTRRASTVRGFVECVRGDQIIQ